MNQIPQIDINNSALDILEAKLKFHDEQILFHKKQKDELKKIITFLKGAGGNTSVINMTATVTHSDIKPLNVISQKTVKPIVFDILKSGGRYTTAKMFEVIKENLKISDSDRGDWIAAISSSLNSLTTYNKINAYPTGVGRIKEFEIKEDIYNAERLKRVQEDFAEL